MVGCLLFCVDVIDGKQQCCSVLQVTSCDIDGIIHRDSCHAGFGCFVGSFRSFRITWADVSSDEGFHKERCTPITYSMFCEIEIC